MTSESLSPRERLVLGVGLALMSLVTELAERLDGREDNSVLVVELTGRAPARKASVAHPRMRTWRSG
jgi:hypothetical protein